MSRRIACCMSLVALAVSACAHQSPTPTLDSWSKFQTDLAAWFDQHYGRPNNMRFAPVGIAYPIGSVLRRGSNSVLSSRCVYRSELPKPLPGPTIPTINAERTIDAKLDAGSYAAKLLGEGSKLGVDLKIGPMLTVKMVDPTVVILAEDQTSSVFADTSCLSAVVGLEVSIVRGYLDAKYTVSSSAGLTADANATVKSNDIVKLTVKDSDKFSIEDAKSSPKMVVLADARVDKEIVVATGNVLLSKNLDRSVCAEVPRLVLKTSTDRSAGGVIPETVTGQSFTSCDAVTKYLDACGQSPESARACLRAGRF